MFPGSVELPCRRQPDVAVPAVVPVVDDVETAGVEVADADPVAARVDIRATHVDVLEESLARGLEVADDRVDHHPSQRRLVMLAQEGLLLVPRLGRGLLDGRLAHEAPTGVVDLLGERLALVPVLVVEEVVRLVAHTHERRAPEGDQHVRVLTRTKRRLRERDHGEGRDQLRRRLHVEVLRHLLEAEHVAPHDGAGTVVVGGTERELTNGLLHRRAELVAAGDDQLDGVAVEPQLVHGLPGRSRCEVADLISLTERDR